MKNLPAEHEMQVDSWVNIFPGEGNGIPLQYSCLENPMDRGAWWVIVHGIAKESEMTKQQIATIKKKTNSMLSSFILFYLFIYLFFCSEFCHTLK